MFAKTLGGSLASRFMVRFMAFFFVLQQAQATVGASLLLKGRELVDGARGDVNTASITTVMVGLLFMVIGLALLTTIMTSASTAGASAVAGSFTNATSISDLAPLVFAAVVIVGGASMIGLTVFRVARGGNGG